MNNDRGLVDQSLQSLDFKCREVHDLSTSIYSLIINGGFYALKSGTCLTRKYSHSMKTGGSG